MRGAMLTGLICVGMSSGLVSAQALGSETGEARLSPVTVTGSRLPEAQTGSRNPDVVITREMMEARQARNVAELLQTVPGLHVEQAGSGGSVSAVYLRGAETNFTLVMINGVVVNDSTNSRGGSYDFSGLDIDSIERIEINKGPASFVYGSNAMAGVINIITRKEVARSSTRLKATGGGQGYARASASIARLFEEGEFGMHFAYTDNGEVREGDSLRSASANVDGVMDLSALTQLTMNLRLASSDATAFPEASGGPEYAVLRDTDERERHEQQLGLKLDHQLSSAGNLSLQTTFTQSHEDMQSPGVDMAIPANESDSLYDRRSVLAAYSQAVTESLSSVIGVEWVREYGNSDGSLDFGGPPLPTAFSLTREITSAFLELEQKFESGFSAAAGARMDKTAGQDTQFSPQTSLMYSAADSRIRLQWGEGYKLPSFFALGHPLVGNPDFEPEQSENLSLDILYTLASGSRVRLSAFHSRYENLIDFDDSGVLVSRDEVDIDGIELGFEHPFNESLRVSASATLLNMDVVGSDDELHKRPDAFGEVRLYWQASDKVTANVALAYTGEVMDFAYPTGTRTLDACTRLDAAVSWRVMPDLDAGLAIDNLLDADYEEAIGFAAPGRMLRLSLTGRLL